MCCVHEGLHILRKKSDVFSRAILQYKGNTTGGTDSGNCRRRKCKRDAFTEARQFLRQMGLDCFVLFFGFLAFAPGFEVNEEKSAVSALHEAQQAKADDTRGVLDARCIGENAFDLATRLIGALK